MNHAGNRNEVLPSPVLGMMIFIGTEVMFFCGLISAFLVIRAGTAFWPPPGQPRLPVEATAFNTLVLLASGVTVFLAGRALAAPDGAARARKLAGLTILLGAFFVLFQGYEWVRLLDFGLRLSSSLYGGLFYVIIGAHAFHVMAALAFLAWVWVNMIEGEQGEAGAHLFAAARLFWYFVVAVWPVLYGLVYLY